MVNDPHTRLATVCATMGSVGASKVYTAVSRVDGKCYILRRIEGNVEVSYSKGLMVARRSSELQAPF